MLVSKNRIGTYFWTLRRAGKLIFGPEQQLMKVYKRMEGIFDIFIFWPFWGQNAAKLLAENVTLPPVITSGNQNYWLLLLILILTTQLYLKIQKVIPLRYFQQFQKPLKI